MIVDGATNWGPDGPKPAVEGFDVAASEKSIYEWVRQVRGGVLAGAFTVELHLSAAIIFFMLGDRNLLPEVEVAFDEGLLSQLTFERRITVGLMVAPHFLAPQMVSALKADLSELRTLRNAMAHHSFWFQPLLDDKGEVFKLVPMIKRGKGAIPLTTAFIEKLNVTIASLIERTAALADAVRKREQERGRDVT